jgi:hypothetical protein
MNYPVSFLLPSNVVFVVGSNVNVSYDRDCLTENQSNEVYDIISSWNNNDGGGDDLQYQWSSW